MIQTNDDSPLDPDRVPGRFGDIVGYRLLDWQEGTALLELWLDERHRNRSGVMHGGVLATLIDAACGYAGTYCSVPGNVRRAMTLQLSTQFIAAGRAGQRLLARSRCTGGGRSVFFASAEVSADSGPGSEAKLIGRGEGVFRYRRGAHALEGVPAETYATNRRG
ncbi:PaaI family thioesterase [Aquibaculum arenosum]|uniref:PaaI family thioesterase n=1 Tax=Aquibaculum arenosum TaxID=3032591 RepID=A0ABT5YKW2_9PROT|nr:PaaI family thioesterase [Fodinicurvata sp. CAU 1616]MDF2094899.1 PaaI family thioesterase [Fodinicurvata sp. CAU 1616]